MLHLCSCCDRSSSISHKSNRPNLNRGGKQASTSRPEENPAYCTRGRLTRLQADLFAYMLFRWDDHKLFPTFILQLQPKHHFEQDKANFHAQQLTIFYSCCLFTRYDAHPYRNLSSYLSCFWVKATYIYRRRVQTVQGQWHLSVRCRFETRLLLSTAGGGTQNLIYFFFLKWDFVFISSQPAHQNILCVGSKSSEGCQQAPCMRLLSLFWQGWGLDWAVSRKVSLANCDAISSRSSPELCSSE